LLIQRDANVSIE